MRDWQSQSVSFVEHLAQYYFTGAVEDAEMTEYSQTVTDLDFEWLNQPVPVIENGLSPEELAGTWLDSDGDGYIFHEDGTGTYKEGGDSWELTYMILNCDSVSITYSDGDHKTFYAELDGDELTFDRDWTMKRQ